MSSHRAARTAERRSAAATPATPSRAGVFPAFRDIVSPRGPFLLPLVLLVVTRVLMLLMTTGPAEDAFITFRYARNLASGNGLVYNPGERVMGFTSPVWTVWNALGIAILRDPVIWSRAWALVADAITLLVGGVLVRRAATPLAAGCFTFFFAVWPYFAAVTASGLEMSACLAALVLAAGWSAARSRLAGPALGTLALLRPEGLLAAAIVSIGTRARDRWIAAAIVGVAAAGLGAWYGSPLPSSLTSKAMVYGTPGPAAGRLWWEWLSPVILGRWPATTDGVQLSLLAVVLAPATVLGVIALARVWREPAALVAAGCIAIGLGYALVGVTYFWWYLTFPLFGVAVAAAVGLPSLVRGRALLVAVALYMLSVWSVAWNLYSGRSKVEAETFGAMATALRDRCRPGDTVLLEPIGIIGYTAPVVVIDETGLVTPEVAKRRRQGEGWYADLVTSRRPDWIVIRRGVLESDGAFAGVGRPFRDATERSRVLAAYRTVGQSGEKTDASTLMLLGRTDQP